MSEIIFHFTTLPEWERAQDKGFYESSRYNEEGFIHCATKEQLDKVIEKHFKKHTNLIQLVIDTARLNQPLKYELAPGTQDEYPHIYGPLNLQAVTEVIFLDPITSED
jgi:uncharacterized protein (DUF952 family)